VRSLLPCVLFLAACSTTRHKVEAILDNTNRALVSTERMTNEVRGTVKELKEETVPALTETIKEAELAIQNLDRNLRLILSELRPLVLEVRAMVATLLSKLNTSADKLNLLLDEFRKTSAQASEITRNVNNRNRQIDMLVYGAAGIGLLVIILLIVIIHHKITSKTRHKREFEHIVKNGGRHEVERLVRETLEKSGDGRSVPR